MTTSLRLSILALAALAGGCALPLVSESEVETESVKYFEAKKQEDAVSNDAGLIRYVNCVASDVIAQLEPEYSSRDWEVVVFETDEINAFATAGQKIGVNTGLFKVVQNQDQLATVLGHEVAHVTHKHTLERARRAMTAQGGVLLAGTALGGSRTAYDLAGLGANLGVMLPFERGDETEADKVGLRYMSQAGFDPRQAVPLWKNMSKNNKLGAAAFLTNHPSDESRLSSLIKELPADLPLYNQAQAAGRKPDCER